MVASIETISFKPESRAGIQLNYKPTTELSLVGQVGGSWHRFHPECSMGLWWLQIQ